MEKKKHYGMLLLYYTGILLGSVLLNHLIEYRGEYLQNIYDAFLNISKMDYVSCKELIIYLFLKRWKQILYLMVLFSLFPKNIVYYSFCMIFFFLFGAVVSFFFYYEKIRGIFKICVLMVPVLFYLAAITYFYRKSSFEKEKQGIHKKNMIVPAFLISFGTVVEYLIYLVLNRYCL